MAKATGELIAPYTIDEFKDKNYEPAHHGDTVTIELERGYKVIGTCKECQYFGNDGLCWYGPNMNDATLQIKNCGCGNWKPRKEPK